MIDKLKVLAIDDRQDNLIVLQAIVSDAFPESKTFTATNGPSGIDIALTEDPDVILLDIVMPEMDGFEVCRRLKKDENTEHIPVVFITAMKTDSSTHIKALDVGGEGFLSKPFDESELIAQIRAMAKIKSANQMRKNERERLEALVFERTRELHEELEERQRLEKLYRLLAENTKDCIWLLKMDYEIAYMNPSCKELFGFSPEELQDKCLHELCDTEDRSKIPAFFDSVRLEEASGRYLSLETELSRKDGGRVSVQMTARLVRDEKGRAIGFQGVTRDITERVASARKLEEAFYSLVRVVSDLVDKGDPYTAGHQRNVSRLAVAIAQELSLNNGLRESVAVSALLHDIGKLLVPADILAKPGKLSEIEFELTKRHADAGYEILRNARLPWPVAEIIRQHHERLDCSGYPQALCGENIRLEARILAVADVVEAMSSHRPYRPALGVDKALEEIQANRGRLYDTEVVDACTRVFRERDFQF